MYKNWTAICEIENVWLRMLVALTEDDLVLAKLIKGFPELFCEGKTELKIPFSALKVKAQEVSHDNSVVLMYEVLDPFGLPSINFGFNGDEGLSDKVPSEMVAVVTEIHDERLGYDILIADTQADPSPRIVVLNEERCWIAEICAFEPDTGFVDELTLVPAKFIDFAR
jgi:hypothetical protein